MPPDTAQPSRADVRAARQFAEQVFQALRRWETCESDLERYSVGPSSSARFQVVGVGNWRSGPGGTGATGTQSLLVLPGGAVPEGRVGLIILDLMHGDRQERVYADLLARIQTGSGPASLLDDGGSWRGDRNRSVLYALAVTELMKRLRNDSAADHLPILHSQLSISQD